ncbi:MAG: heavy metal translocating P-type ATPase [Methanobrevibacter sp.]|nr:heavy metal translocating P-type ATPase [Methanobrevibacter sp.]
MNNKKEKKKIEIPIEGMNCASCALNVENSINKLEGVQSQVDINTNKARVEYDPQSVAIWDIEKSIENAGYKVKKSEISLQIAGMHCANCVTNIEEKLKSLDGVYSVNVNLNSQKALVYYDKNQINSEDMGKAIINQGFDYLGVANQVDPDADDKLYEKDLKDKKNRIIVGFIFSGILMGLMFTPHMAFHNIGISMLMSSLLIAIIPFIYVSYPIIKAGFNSLAHKNLDMDVMYTMGILVAFISSLLGTFNIILDSSFMFYETAIMLPSFLMLGRYLESKAKRKTSSSIKQLIHLQPKTATLLIKKENFNENRGKENLTEEKAIDSNEYEEKEILIEDIAIDDIILVKPGDKVPIDGLVLDGESYVEESMITGEPIAKLKSKNDKVFAGTINQDGILKIKATHIGKDTVLSQIIDLVEKAQTSKAPVQKIADKVVKYFIPTILLIAIVSFIVWYLILGSTLLFALTTLISVLVVACPCALGLATPTAVTVGIGRAAEYGILIKNGSTLENAGNVSIAIFDKTGTITEGNPEISDVFILNNDNNDKNYLNENIENFKNNNENNDFENKNKNDLKNNKENNDFEKNIENNLKNNNENNDFEKNIENNLQNNNESELIQLIASLENNSTHPIAKAITKKAKEMNLKLDKVDEFENIRGKGLKGKIKGKTALAGNKSLLKDENIAISEKSMEKYDEFVNEGKTAIFLVYNDSIKGIITLTDKIKDNSKKTIENLHSMKIATFMISGDNGKTAIGVANEVGIENVLGDVLPNEKLEKVRELQKSGENKVLFVGDGINDAPAISGADVGVALGSGTDIAMESGDIVLIKGDLENVVGSIEFSKKVMTRIKENIFWAFAYNIILIPIAAGLLYPLFGIIFRPEFAGLAMALSSVTVISLSLMLKRYVPPIKRGLKEVTT